MQVTRSLDSGRGPKRLYYVSKAVQEMLLLDQHERLKVTSTGLKMFERQESKVTPALLVTRSLCWDELTKASHFPHCICLLL